MTEPITLTIGVPGESDVILIELDNARGWMEAKHGIRMDRDEAVVYLIGLGLGLLHNEGLPRATPAGAGLNPHWRPG